MRRTVSFAAASRRSRMSRSENSDTSTWKSHQGYVHFWPLPFAELLPCVLSTLIHYAPSFSPELFLYFRFSVPTFKKGCVHSPFALCGTPEEQRLLLRPCGIQTRGLLSRPIAQKGERTIIFNMWPPPQTPSHRTHPHRDVPPTLPSPILPFTLLGAPTGTEVRRR